TREWVAIGIGINVRNELPKEVKRTAICLGHLLPDITPEALVEPLANRLRLMGDSGPMLTLAEASALTSRDYLFGRRLLEPLPGVARGVSREGELVVEIKEGVIQAVRTGHVVLAGPA
ncbi:MAG TPA: hypothetical protein VFU03_08285, partial [Gemmatimonadales bacterium]|nr:hypothetical protein [Gemmatimonadales bacterium]